MFATMNVDDPKYMTVGGVMRAGSDFVSKEFGRDVLDAFQMAVSAHAFGRGWVFRRRSLSRLSANELKEFL